MSLLAQRTCSSSSSTTKLKRYTRNRALFHNTHTGQSQQTKEIIISPYLTNFRENLPTLEELLSRNSSKSSVKKIFPFRLQQTFLQSVFIKWTLNPAGSNSWTYLCQCTLTKVKGLFSRGKVAFLQQRESKHKDCEGSSFNFETFLSPKEDKPNRVTRVKLAGVPVRRTGYGHGGMSMSTPMMLPIIGSPPGPDGMGLYSSSPMDDIAALTGAFQAEHQTPGSGRNIMSNRRFTLRRKLSTSFDDPVSTGILANLASISKAEKEDGKGGSGEDCSGVFGGSGTVNVVRQDSNNGISAGGNNTGGGAWLEEHFKKFMALRISESSDDDILSGVSSGSGGGGGGSRRSSNKFHEDIFQLLEKVIGFKGRNVSHITVEQSVKDLCTVYSDTGDAEKLKFFNVLSEKYGVDHPTIVSLANSLSLCEDQQMRLTLEEKLRAALIPKYQWLFSQVGRLDNGVKFLVDLRTDILDAIEKSTESTTHLKALNNCLKDLIGVWFAVGFLKLERITWNSSCEMLQKISEYEAVHPMRNWTDLKKRVGPNRRCFVFTHGSMPVEPVVVLHTALTNHIPSCIHKIVTKRRLMSLDNDTDMSAAEEIEDHDFIDTAIFYSITSTQRGLTGIELGNYLIKRVVRELQMEFPKINKFSSLSPIPGFSKWLIGSIKTAQRNPDSQTLLTRAEIEKLVPIFQSRNPDKNFFGVFLDVLKLNEWYSDTQLVEVFEEPLMRLCSHYLYLVKRRGYAMDPVAHFHLKNGAVLWRLNWLADASPRGLSNSCGIMVNYRYFLEDCETNSQTYLEQQTIQIADQVHVLVKKTEVEMDSKM